MRKILNLTSWVLLFLFAPFTLLILLSQNSVPGDLFYPVKRGLEGIVLAAASASPATRVAFRTDLTERRFKEAEKLLLAKADATALGSFILEVQSTQEEVDALSGALQKSQATEKLIAKIDDYQVKLTQLQAQTQSTSASSVVSVVEPTSSPQINQPQAVQQPQSTFQQTAPPPSDSGQAGQSAPLLQPTSPPQQPTVVVQNLPAQTAVASPEQQRVVSETIVTTKIELERIKKDLEEKKERHKEERKEREDLPTGRQGKEKRSERKDRNHQEE